VGYLVGEPSSCLKRSRMAGFPVSSGRITLSATMRFTSDPARGKQPMPPSPRSCRISYRRPNMAPAARQVRGSIRKSNQSPAGRGGSSARVGVSKLTSTRVGANPKVSGAGDEPESEANFSADVPSAFGRHSVGADGCSSMARSPQQDKGGTSTEAPVYPIRPNTTGEPGRSVGTEYTITRLCRYLHFSSLSLEAHDMSG